MNTRPHSRGANSDAGVSLSRAEVEHRLEVLRANGGNASQAARDLNCSRGAMQHFKRKHKDEVATKLLREVGYDLNVGEKTAAQAWAEHAGHVDAELSRAMSNRWRTIHRSKGPFVLFHGTDEHIDDNTTPLRLIEADIGAAHAMDAIMCHGGDLLNNWPVAGKLAKQWAEQQCTMPDALLRAQHFITIFKPDVWTHGNHEEMNPYLMRLLDSWLPDNVIADYWSVNFMVETPGGRPLRASMSHKYQKGSSWFHPHHGVLREMLEGEEADLYMDGHIHVSGSMVRVLPERGISALAVVSAGYKCVDNYASRISRGGKVPKLRGRAHWIVADPSADDDSQMCFAFDCPTRAEAMLNGLQNLRTV